jgi:hypothetical protein
MDPYLEDPLLWPSVHHLLISQIGTTLNRLLPSGYVAAVGERVLVPVSSDEVIESFVEIRALADNQRLVTAIEVLSPRNKTAGTEGRQLYRQKQREVLAGDVHLLEIDLLRSGLHTVAAPREALLRRGTYHYLVSLSRAHRRQECEVWAILLSSPLPRVRVPLAAPDPDVELNLTQVYQQVYEAGAFDRVVDYTQPPKIPLSKADAEWVAEQLRSSGRLQ